MMQAGDRKQGINKCWPKQVNLYVIVGMGGIRFRVR